MRSYRACKQHSALALAAYTLLAVVSVLAEATRPAPVLPDDPDQPRPTDVGMIALTAPEIQRLHLSCPRTQIPSPTSRSI